MTNSNAEFPSAPLAKVSKRQYSEAEKAKVVQEFNESDLSIPAFAKEVGIASSTLHRWLKEKQEQEFIPVVQLANSKPTSTVEEHLTAVELKLPHGIVLKIPTVKI